MEKKRDVGKKLLGEKVISLKNLSIDDLFDIFESLRAIDDGVEKELKYVCNRLFEKEYGEPLSLDEFSLVTDTPEKIINVISQKISEIIRKDYASRGVVTTQASIKHESTKRAVDLFTRALRLVIIKYGAW